MRYVATLLLSLALFMQVSFHSAYAETSGVSFILDVDNNGEREPLTDGLLTLRYLFQLRGSALIDKAIGEGATRTTAQQIETYLNEHINELDVDGNGDVDPLSDGLMVIRYLFDFRGIPLIENAIAPGATRTELAEILAYLHKVIDENNALVANAGSDQAVVLGSSVTLDGTASSDADNAIVLYAWGLLHSSGVSATQLATDVKSTISSLRLGLGTHTIVLAIRNDEGTEASDTVIITVTENQSPIAVVSPVSKTITEGDAQTLDASVSSDPEGGLLSFVWSGNGTEGCGNSQTCTLSNLGVGTQVITVAVTDNTDNVSTATSTITVKAALDPNQVPSAIVTPTSKTIEEGQTVLIDASSSNDPDGDSLTYIWSGMGTGSCGNSATCLVSGLTVSGSPHSTSISINDGNGGTDSATATITVTTKPNQNPNALVSPTSMTIEEGQTATLDASTSSDPDGDSLSYDWKGVGTESCDSSAICVVTGLTVSGSPHTIIVDVFDGIGGAQRTTATITVTEKPNQVPTARVTPTTTTIEEGKTATLNALTSSDPDGDSLSYSWSGTGTGNCGTSATCIVTGLSASGSPHAITVTVTDGKGGTDSDTSAITVNAIPNQVPTANAGEDIEITEGENRTITGIGSDIDGTIRSYLWVDGGSTLSTSAIVSLASLSAGVHTLTLTVIDDDGATANDSTVVIVNADDSEVVN